MNPPLNATVVGGPQSVGCPAHALRTTLMAAVFGLAVPMVGLAQTAPPAKPAKPAKTAEEKALQKAIDAVNRGVEKSKTADEDAPKPAKTAEPTRPTAAKPIPPAPAPPPATRPTKATTATTAASEPSQPPTTRITSEEDGELRNKEGLIIFRTNVLVDREDLKIWSDELHVSLNQQAAKQTEPPPAEGPPPKKPAENPDAFSAQNVKQVLAKAGPGGFVVIWRKTAQGEVVAMARETIYDGATGNITLRGAPEVLRDLKLHVSSPGEDNRIVLMKNGDVKGSKHTGFVQADEAREIRKRILAHAPVRRGGPPAGGTPSVSAPPATPSTVQQ